MASYSEMKKVFDKFDQNSDGKISYDEFYQLLRALDPTIPINRIRLIMKDIGKDSNGNIGMKEFEDFCFTGRRDVNRVIRKAFDLYDVDEDGFKLSREAHAAINNLGLMCMVCRCGRIIRKFDAEGDEPLRSLRR